MSSYALMGYVGISKMNDLPAVIDDPLGVNGVRRR